MKRKVYNNSELIKKITVSGLLLALFFVLPTVTGAIPEIGGALCPMHIVAFLAGAFLGGLGGALLSFAAPILRGLILGSPTLFPRGISMAAELFAYALVFGLLVKLLPKKIGYVYVSLVSSMLVGRVVGGPMKLVLVALGVLPSYSFAAYFTAYFVETLPGMILHLIIVPPSVVGISRAMAKSK